MQIELTGCPFQPLAAYLKALAVLRLVSQEDHDARGDWSARYFVLHSKFDSEALVEFFLYRYDPTPLLAPWNAGSGFYPKDRKVGFNAIRSTAETRFAAYRADLKGAETIVAEAAAIKDDDARRTDILRMCRNQLSDGCVDWLDATIAISAEESRAFAPILGTGGNEGRLDYTNTFMENIACLLISPDKKTPVRGLLEHALFGKASDGLQNISVGQYDPGRTGGFNQGNAIESGSVANAWNAVFTLEGAVAWAGGIYRKQGVSYRSFLCSPFTVRPSAVGYGSASEKDEGSARAELWTPLWDNPARYQEIRSILREGRAVVGGKAAQNGIDFAQAAASLGVDRAITSFVRYSLVKRRGDSYIALPIGKFPVEYRSTADRVRELMPYLEKADAAAKGSQSDAPTSWLPLMHATKNTIYLALQKGTGASLIEVASAFGAMHRWLLLRGVEVRWPARLSSDWIKSCWHKPEGSIAAALAGMWSIGDKERLASFNPGNTQASWVGRDLTARMLSTLRRKTLDGERSRESPFCSNSLTTSEDVVAFLEHRIDEELTENLLFAFLLAQHSGSSRPTFNPDEKGYRRWPAFCILKQLFANETYRASGARVGNGKLRPDLAIVALLSAGRVREATEAAMHRLRVSGLELALRSGWDADEGPRLGAALLIPISIWDTVRLRDLIELPTTETER